MINRKIPALALCLLLCGAVVGSNMVSVFGAERKEEPGIEKVTSIELTQDYLIVTGVLQKSTNGEVSAMLHRADNGFLDSYDGSAYPAGKGKDFTFFFNAGALELDRDGNGSYFIVMADTGNTGLSVENLINVGYRVDFEVKNGVLQSSLNGGAAGGSADKTDPDREPSDRQTEDTATGGKPAGGELPDTGGNISTSGAMTITINDIEGHWAEKSIRALVEKGIVAGYQNGAFRPENTVTRAEFAQIVWKAFGLEKKQDIQTFYDVKKDDWYFDAVTGLYENGIVSGVDKNRYAPEDAITREQMAVILSGTAKTINLDLAKKREYIPFADEADLSDYAAGAVKTMYCAGIISGTKEDGETAYRFVPADGATRAEVAAIIDRLLNQMEQ